MVPRAPRSSRSHGPTFDHFAECFAEVIGQERVEDWVDAGVHVSHHLADNLHHNAGVGDLVHVDTLQHQDDLQAKDRWIMNVYGSYCSPFLK